MSDCPFNYAGSKSDYPDLHVVSCPLVDLFGGGGGFWSHVASDDVVVNDSCFPLVSFQAIVREASDPEFEALVARLRAVTGHVDSREAYEALRAEFNASGDPEAFYATLCCCTNNLIRFNRSGGFNQTWGRRSFNAKMEAKLRAFRERVKRKRVVFSSCDFTSVDPGDRLVFADPPYLVTGAGYNAEWSRIREEALYDYLVGKRFLLTNFLRRGPLANEVLHDRIKRCRWRFRVIRTGTMKATRNDSDFVEVLVSSFDPREVGIL